MKLIFLFLLAIGHGTAVAQAFTVTLGDNNGTILDSLTEVPDMVKVRIQSRRPSSQFQIAKVEVLQLRGTNTKGSVYSTGPSVGIKWQFPGRLPTDRFAFKVFIDELQDDKVINTSQESFVYPPARK